MKTKRILLAIVCLIVILGGLNYLLQQSPMPIGTPGSTPVGGATQFVGKHDIKDSPYFKHPDFYNMQSDEHLTILPKFATTQQITHYTCGPAAANMVVKYYKGKTLDDELAVAKIMGSSKTVGEIIYSDVFNRRAREYNLLQQELEINTRAMSVVEQELSRNKLALSAETMSAIEQHRKEIGRLQQELKQIEYQIKQENEKRLSSIITANVIIIPAAVIILLAGCFLFIRRRKLNAVKEIFNVSSSD